VRTRMPGGVAGAPSITGAPYAYFATPQIPSRDRLMVGKDFPNTP
jgi:hypothetical protein